MELDSLIKIQAVHSGLVHFRLELNKKKKKIGEPVRQSNLQGAKQF